MVAARSDKQLELIPRTPTIGDAKIECPHCHSSFRLNETLTAPLVEETRRRYERELEEKEQELHERLEAQAKAEAIKAKQKLDSVVAERDAQLSELGDMLKSADQKLAESRKAELEFRKKQRELDDKLKDAELEIEKRLQVALEPLRLRARQEAEDQQRLRLAEKEKTIADLQSKLQEAIRKAEQGSQQMQGEVQELDLERRLREAFVRDTIEPVAKGQQGGDVLQRVLSASGDVSGAILWESKRTKHWSPAWIDKLKQDQRAARADLAVIVTQAMPQGVTTFTELDGVWVTTPELAIALAGALRLGLAEAFTARRAAAGQQDKMAILYQYMTGPQFRQRVLAIVEAFSTMQADLEAERRVVTKVWAKRAQQIDRVIDATSGMYGELQAIAGAAVLEIEGLELKALADPDPEAGTEH